MLLDDNCFNVFIPTAPTYLSAASKSTGLATSRRFQRKKRHYENLGTNAIPIVLESYGFMHKEISKIIRSVTDATSTNVNRDLLNRNHLNVNQLFAYEMRRFGFFFANLMGIHLRKLAGAISSLFETSFLEICPPRYWGCC